MIGEATAFVFVGQTAKRCYQRSRVEARFQAAIDREDYELAWRLFDHLWPGVWPLHGD